MDEIDKNHKYNADELIAPSWINDDFLEKVLKNCMKCGNNEIKILKSKITPGSSKNDHYASIMFRAVVDFSMKKQEKVQIKSLIIKTTPIVEGVKKELLDKMSAFETEIGMYTEALPKIEGILRKYGDETVLAAGCLYHSLEPHKVIVFEDLVDCGYGTIDRPTSLEEVKAALMKLAKLHAVSYKLGVENNKLITSFREGVFNGNGVLEMDIVKEAIPNFKDALRQFDDLKCYIPYVENIEDELLKKCVDVFNAFRVNSPVGIFVLNHGDFHMKNMMFKWNVNGTLRDIILVDYQMSFFGPAVVDLLYSTIMLMSQDLRRNHRDELFHFYFVIFRDTLKLIQFKGKTPTMADFQIELIKYRHWELFLVMGFLPMVTVLTDDNADVAALVEDQNYRKKLLTNPSFIEEIRELLPKLLYKGYFE